MVYVFRFSLTTLLLAMVLVGCGAQNNDEQRMNVPEQIGYKDGRDGVTSDRNNRNGTVKNDDRIGATDDRTNRNRNNVNNTNRLANDGNRGDDNDGRSRMEIADEAAERVAQLEEVRQANVVTTDNNAYVAALLEDDADLGDDIENDIALKVKAVDPDIDNVNVSTNPDFVERVQQYANAVERGEPVEGLVDQLTEAIQRMFPTQR